MSSVPNPPAEQPGANAEQASPSDGSEHATFLSAWARLMRAVGRDLPANVAATNAATRRIGRVR